LYIAECWSIKKWHIQQVSIAEMHIVHKKKLKCACYDGFVATQRYCAWNDDIMQWLEVAAAEYKFVQYCLRWFRHNQWRPLETPILSGVMSHTGNGKRGRGRSTLTWEKSMKRDLND
jgi:hypothetical protein